MNLLYPFLRGVRAVLFLEIFVSAVVYAGTSRAEAAIAAFGIMAALSVLVYSGYLLDTAKGVEETSAGRSAALLAALVFAAAVFLDYLPLMLSGGTAVFIIGGTLVSASLAVWWVRKDERDVAVWKLFLIALPVIGPVVGSFIYIRREFVVRRRSAHSHF